MLSNYLKFKNGIETITLIIETFTVDSSIIKYKPLETVVTIISTSIYRTNELTVWM